MIIQSYQEHQQETRTDFLTGADAQFRKAENRLNLSQEEVPYSKPSEYIPAIFQETNMVTSLLSSETAPFVFEKYDPNYYAYDNLGEFKNTEFEDTLLKAKNPQHMEALKNYAQRAKKNRDIIENTPMVPYLMTTLAAGILSPEVLIPGFKIVQGAKGVSLMATAATGAAYGGAGAMVYEGGMRISQPDRTPTDTAITIGAGAILGSFLGGAAGALTRGQYDNLAKGLMKDIQSLDAEDNVPLLMQADNAPKAAGAQVVEQEAPFTADELKIEGRGAQLLSWLDSKNPLYGSTYNKIMNSSSVAAKNTFVKLAEMAVPLRANQTRTLPVAVETEQKRYNAMYARYWREHLNMYQAHKKAEKDLGLEPMTSRAFSERVSRALRNNDIDPDSEFVSRAAQAARKEVLDPMRKEAINLGLFPEDIDAKFADSYLMRRWDQYMLEYDRDGVMEIFKSHYGKKIKTYVKDVERRIKDLEKSKKSKTKGVQAQISKLRSELTEIENAIFNSENNYSEYVEEVADAVYKRLTGLDGLGNSVFIRPAIARGPLKEKLIDIEDNLVEKYLDNDAGRVLGVYTRQMGTDIALTKAFGRPDMADQIAEIKKEFQDKIASAKNERQVRKLQKEKNSLINSLNNMRNLLRGDYKRFSNPDGLGADLHTAIKDINFMRTMGGVTLSSLPDIARVTAATGIRNSFGDVFQSFFRNFNQYKKSVDSSELRALGFDAETVLATRVIDFADLDEPLARTSKLTQATGYSAQKFAQLTFINNWNNMSKNIIARATQRRIIQAVQSEKMSAKDKRYLNFLGLNDADQRVIREQVGKHGQKIDDTYYSGFENWDESAKAVAMKYESALRKEADTFIVTKSVADIPEWGHTAVGQLLLQLKTFTMASYQRQLMRGLSDNDAKFWTSVLMSVAIGHMVTQSKETGREVSRAIAGKDPYEKDDKLSQDIFDAVDRSGVIAKLLEMNNLSHAFKGPSLQKAFDFNNFSRINSIGAWQYSAGVSAGLIDGADAIGNIGNSFVDEDQDVRGSDISKVRRLMPFNNAIGISYFFDLMERGAGEVLDAK